MQQNHTIVIEQGLALPEEGIVVAAADMLEHADRHDAIECLRHVAIVLHSEPDLAGQSLFGSANACKRMLLLRERYAGDARAAEFGEIERKATPTAADVEHAL